MTSLWLDRAQDHRTDTAHAPNAEVAVVGAGITGLVTAVLLARAGKRVVVIEARTPGAVTTGNTTAKVSLLQGTRLSTIGRRHSVDLVSEYVEGNREGQAWLTQYCQDNGVDLQYEDAYTYAQSDRGLPSAQAEFEAARAVGLGVEWVDRLDVAFPFAGGVRLAGQVQFDPMPFLDALIAELRDRGGPLLTGRRVHAASTEEAGCAWRCAPTTAPSRSSRPTSACLPPARRFWIGVPSSPACIPPGPTAWPSRFPVGCRAR